MDWLIIILAIVTLLLVVFMIRRQIGWKPVEQSGGNQIELDKLDNATVQISFPSA